MHSTTMKGEFWFIPVDIFMIVLTIVIILLGVLLLVIVAMDRTCRTVSVMLVCNSVVIGLFFALVMLSMSSFALRNDLKQVVYEDALCTFRGYLDYLAAALQNHSFVLHAIHRYMTVVHPSSRMWRSTLFQAVLIVLQWLVLTLLFLPLLITGQINYNGDNQICQIPLRWSMPIIYVTLWIFVIPMSIIVFIYFRLLRYVKKIGKQSKPGNKLFHARRQLKMVRRIFILIDVLLLLGLPYTTFIVMSFVAKLPKYHFRIIFVFVYVSSILVMGALFYCTQTIKKAAVKFIDRALCRPRSETMETSGYHRWWRLRVREVWFCLWYFAFFVFKSSYHYKTVLFFSSKNNNDITMIMNKRKRETKHSCRIGRKRISPTRN